MKKKPAAKKKLTTGIPAKIRIGHVVYKTESVSPTGQPGVGTVYGYTSHTTQRITIMNGQHGGVLADTLLHECLHALFEATAARRHVTSDQEENLIRCLTPGLLMMLYDNKKLVRLLQRLVG